MMAPKIRLEGPEEPLIDGGVFIWRKLLNFGHMISRYVSSSKYCWQNQPESQTSTMERKICSAAMKPKNQKYKDGWSPGEIIWEEIIRDLESSKFNGIK